VTKIVGISATRGPNITSHAGALKLRQGREPASVKPKVGKQGDENSSRAQEKRGRGPCEFPLPLWGVRKRLLKKK